ncbi:MAG: putative C-S lyase [Rhodospirillales bacterium]|jgi:cysteine-S-conjugate beta-lyase|nr:putative C-S lyase [Rhodospirillales bacterium]
MDFDTIIDRFSTGSSKWSRYPADVLPLWVADMDFAVSPAIIAVLRARMDHPVFGYGVAKGELTEQIVEHLDKTYSWKISPEDVVFLPGVEPGINMALNGLLSPGDGVTVQTPVYPPILKSPTYWHLNRFEEELMPDEEDSYLVDMVGFNAAMGKSKAFLMCNPHNPLGKVFARAELEAMAAVCLENDALIISDEIHCDLVFDGRRHVPIASLGNHVANRCITLMAASKSYNIAGLKTAFAIVQNREIRETFVASKLGMVDSVNILGYEATLAAYAEGGEWLRGVVRYLQDNRDWLVNAVNTRLSGISMKKPEGTFLGWLDCSGCEFDGDPHLFFLEKSKVAMNPGKDFGPSGRNFVRINFGCPRPVLEDGIQRIEASLKGVG